jgi:transcriptional regulator with XRE-family HTH domain
MGRSSNYPPNYLRNYRKLNGYSQKYVASRLGLRSIAIISRWEKGVTRPGIENLLKLSLLYSTLIDQLYFDLREEMKGELATYGQPSPNKIVPKNRPP